MVADVPRTPCYVLDKEIAQKNATEMLERAAKLGCTLRPHVKTHKTIEGALMQTGGRPSGIVVSTLREACFFADGGFTDILYAVPITPDKVPAAAELSRRCKPFHVMVDNAQQLEALFAHDTSADGGWSVFVMVDCGYHRDGVDPTSEGALQLAQAIAAHPAARLAGVYTHGGGSYDARSPEECRAYAVEERDAVVGFARRLRAAGLEVPVVGVGSTPTCSHPPGDGLDGVTEMHPGNYVTYDSMQCLITACSLPQVAVRVLTRIVGIYPERKTMTVDLGWTGCSVQGAEHSYGHITSHPELRLKVVKQESGEVVSKDGGELDFSRYHVGDVLELAPWHSCASGCLHEKVLIREGGKLTGEKWTPCKYW